MQSGALKALEFDRIVEAVCRLAQTPPARAARAASAARPTRGAVAAALAATAETARFLSGTGEIALRAPAELDAIARRAWRSKAARSRRCTCSRSRRSSPRSTRRPPASGAPARRSRSCGADRETAASFEREIADIRRKIDPAGEVVDDASPELRSIRDRLRKQRARLRGTLESYLRGKDTAKYLQQQIVTDRNGRYVLVVRVGTPRRRFPASCTAARRAARACSSSRSAPSRSTTTSSRSSSRKQEEVRRILLALTDAFRRRGRRAAAHVDAATTLDVLQAKARYSRRRSAAIAAGDRRADGRLELRGARHPLLDRGGRRRIRRSIAGRRRC